ncbi:hypothetical protein EYY95_14705 [Hafnia alvei]|uniref:hypothetical protein n=1 Tax=Hafnia alvei TaxID=569 RepID=UPI0010349207|nr:hypothetical protein [Hafnia alvei]TBL85655.1 hypothetical protein EYY95_14705 [Hafnia alvei]
MNKLTHQLAVAAGDFLPVAPAVLGEQLSVEVDTDSAPVMVQKIELLAVWQTHLGEIASGVIRIMLAGKTLVLLRESPAFIILPSQRPRRIVGQIEAPKTIVAVGHGDAIWRSFAAEPTGDIPLIGGD